MLRDCVYKPGRWVKCKTQTGSDKDGMFAITYVSKKKPRARETCLDIVLSRGKHISTAKILLAQTNYNMNLNHYTL